MYQLSGAPEGNGGDRLLSDEERSIRTLPARIDTTVQLAPFISAILPTPDDGLCGLSPC